MFHKGLVVLAVAGGLWTAGRMTNLGSYAGTLWSQARTQAKRQVSTQFEIERARHEIVRLDQDIAGMIRPIAEFKASLQRLDNDLRQTRASLDDRRAALLRLTRDLETEPVAVSIAGRSVPFERAKAALERDFEGFQRLEKHSEALEKLRVAKQQSLEAAQEQLAKVIAKKREFEVRLAQLEAEEQTLKIASLGSKIAVDDNRASAIEAALSEIEQRHNVRRAELELAAGDLVSEISVVPTRPERPSHDLSKMRAYLEQAR